MKKKFIALALMLAGLSSCQDEEMVKNNPGFVAQGYGALTIKMTHDLQTRAVGDKVGADVAYKEEKAINSLAFIVKTETDGDKAGTYNYYLSEEDLLSTNGFTEPLELASNDSTYTCQIKVKSQGWATPKVLVIANYKENGIDIAGIVAKNDWANLGNDLRSASLTANPTTPLLMFGKIDNVQTWTTNEGGLASETIKMTRLVSRVDIRNNAYNETDPGKGFVLESARLLNGKEYCYLFDTKTAGEINAVPVVTEFPAHLNVVIDAALKIQKLDSLYTYENTNDAPDKATRLQVNGYFQGSKVSKIIDFKKPDAAGTVGDPIALARNTRYVVNLNPSKDTTNLEWTITVKDWMESDTIVVRPSFPTPTLSDYALTGANATWDASTQTVTLASNYAGGGVLKFKSFAPQASTYAVAFKYETSGRSIKWDSDNKKYENDITEGTPIVTYASEAAGVSREYEISIPAQDSIYAPLDAYVIIQNGSAKNACDTITLRYRPNYENKTIQPVLYKGQYWAPYNCGASKVPSSITTTWSLETSGYLYQWGRNVPFSYNASGDVYPAIANIASYPTYVEACSNTGTYQNKFILGSPSADYTWFKDYKSGAAAGLSPALTVGDNAWPRENQPCPAGWRVPTKSELAPIATEAGGSNKMNGSTFVWKASGNNAFVLPAAGYRRDSNAGSNGLANSGYYWSSTLTTSGKSPYLEFLSTGSSMVDYNLAIGYSVRCIQE